MKMLRGLILAGVGLSLMGGCSQFGNPMDVIQGKVKTPDEFEVVARKPLKMPRTLNLPVPRLGEASPLEPTPRADAASALLGTAPAGTTPGRVSQGEAALLEAANARASDPAIRRVLEEDKTRVDDTQPYQSPSLFSLIGEEDEPIEDPLDPAAEARRLQAEGISNAPVDPNDAGERERTRQSAVGAGASYPNVGRRPDNQLNKEGVPAVQ